MSEELMAENTDTQSEVDPTSPHYQNDPSFIDENQTPEAQEKAILEWQKAAYPGYVKLRSCEEIYDTIYHKRDPIVEGLIDHGTIILGGASKVGKSFLSLQLAYCVSQGLPFLGFKTNQTGVIYFALEDVERRIQHRMQKMFGLEPAKDLYFATEAGYVGGGGFEEQLNTVLHDHPDVGLVIVDWRDELPESVRNLEEFTVYRATCDTPDEVANSLSWTLCKDIAEWFVVYNNKNLSIAFEPVLWYNKTTDGFGCWLPQERRFSMVSGHLRIQNGIYQCIISYNDYNGKRKTKSISTGLPAKGNKKRAEEMLSELRRSFVPPKPERGENEFREDMLFSDFIPLWLSAIEKTVKPTTYSSYWNMAMKKILPYFEVKKLKLNEVKASHIQNFCIHELKSIGANSVKHEYVLLHKMFKYAYRMDLVVNNPVEKVDPPKIMPFEGKPFTADELQKLLDETKDDRMGLVILVTAMYGLRRSEVLGLRWRAIDFQNNLLTINHTLTEVNVKGNTELHATDSTKNKSSRRTLPLSESVKIRLLALKEQQEENRKLCGNAYNKDWLDYVFVNEVGDIIRPSYIESVFPRILKKCGLEHRRFHDLRHTCATLMNQQKVPLKQVQVYLGHSDIQTTSNIYTHLSWDDKTETLEAMEKAVKLPEFGGTKSAWDSVKMPKTS